MNSESLLVLNGPGLARVEEFAEDAFGIVSLSQIKQACEQLCEELNVGLDFRQSDDQEQIIQWIKNEADEFGTLILNQMGCAQRTPIDYARYCTDLEVLTTLSRPVTEIHMTNVFRHDPGTFKALRGPEGKTSLVCGLGLDSYRVAIRAAARHVAGSHSS